MTQPMIDDLALQELKSIMGDDFKLLVDTFVQDSAMRIEAIEKAINEQNAEELRVAAHSFKGSALNLSASRLTEVCKNLEQMGRDNTMANAADTFVLLQQEYDAVKRYLLDDVLA